GRGRADAESRHEGGDGEEADVPHDSSLAGPGSSATTHGSGVRLQPAGSRGGRRPPITRAAGTPGREPDESITRAGLRSRTIRTAGCAKPDNAPLLEGIPMSLLTTRWLGPLTVAALALLASCGVAAAGNKLTGTQVQEYNAAAMDSAGAQWAITELRKFLANDPDSMHAVLARRMIIRAMFTQDAPGPQIIALIDSTGRMLPREPQIVYFYYS